MRNTRLLSLLSLASVLGSSALGACSSSDTRGTTPGTDSGGGGSDGGSEAAVEKDGSTPERDGGSDAPVDAPKDANLRDANGPGATGAMCTFNRDCQAALRCECTEADGCACKAGVRGTGRNGIDPCTSGNDCASSVCVEGPPDGGSFCSDECGSAADCVGPLPVCQTVAFLGTICVRTPPK